MIKHWFRDKIAVWNLFAKRAIGLIGILNTSMLVDILLRERGYTLHNAYFILLLAITYFTLVIVGWMEIKAGVFRKEQQLVTNEQPQIVELLQRVKNIESKLTKVSENG